MQKSWIAVACCLLPFCGCARVQSFRVIDAETGQPVANVQAERFGDVAKAHRAGISESLSLPVEVASTNVGGMANFKTPGQQFSLKKEGYEQVTIRSTLTGVLVRHEGTGQEVPAERVEGMTYIPLRRIGGPGQNSATATTAASKSGVVQASYNAPKGTATSANAASKNTTVSGVK